MTIPWLLVLLGCVPHIVWVGETEQHDLVILRAGRVETLVSDRRSLGRWRYVADASLVAANGHLAWAARTDEGWVVVRDGAQGAAWDGVGEVVLDPTGVHLAYSAVRAGRWFVVVDAAPHGPFDAVFADSLTLREDGAWAAVVEEGDGAHVVFDGVLGPGFDAVGRLRWAGDRVVYAARRAEAWWVVEGEEVAAAGGPLLDLASCGPRRAWALREPAGDVVVADGTRWAAGDRVAEGTLAFDGACGHVFWAESLGAGQILRRDGEALVSGDAVSPPVLDDTGRWGVVVHEADEATVVVDGQAVAREPSAVGLALAPGSRWAFLSWSAEGTWVVTESDRFGPFDEVVPGTLALAAGRWVWVAGQHRKHRWVVADPTGELAPLDLERWALAHRHLPPDDPAAADFSLLLRRVAVAAVQAPDP